MYIFYSKIQLCVVKEQLQDISNKRQSLTATSVVVHLIQLGEGTPSTSPTRNSTYSTPSSSNHGKGTGDINQVEQDAIITDCDKVLYDIMHTDLIVNYVYLTFCIF